MFLGPIKTSLKILLSCACDITCLQEKDLDLITRDVPLVSDVKLLIKEIITSLKLSPWQRCLVPQNNSLTTIIVACDGSTMASSASVYLLSTPMTTGTKDCNLVVTSSLISIFSIPLNESKVSLLGIRC